MSDRHTDLARGLVLTTGPKLVLMILATHACRTCGLCWPGMRLLEAECGMDARTIQRALKVLTQGELVKVLGYATGGRGRSTEYVILPLNLDLACAPCPRCLENLKSPRRVTGLEGENGKP